MEYKYSYKYPQRTLGALAVCNTGVQRCEGSYSWGPGVRDHYLIHYVISGKGSYQAGGRTFALSAGDLFLTCPDESIFYQADPRDPWEYCWVGFHGTEAKLLLDQTDLSEETPVLRGVSPDAYKQMMRIYESRGSLPHQAAFMTGTLYQLLAALMRDRRTPAARRGDDSVQQACEFIGNNLAMPITVEDIAAHVGLSRSRLYRLFMAELRLSPVQVLTQVRIRQACALLKRGDLSVKAVAASVGYENQLYFSRRFREVMGCSPTEFAGNIVI
jgi:AraC-like DNA-binding protein